MKNNNKNNNIIKIKIIFNIFQAIVIIGFIYVLLLLEFNIFSSLLFCSINLVFSLVEKNILIIQLIWKF